jgi:TnpA family transposase
MARRTVLTERQRVALYGLPENEPAFLHHYVLSDHDIEIINQRRRPENKLGYALQICSMRYPGRLLQPGEEIPSSLMKFIGAQIGLTGDDLLHYAQRSQTRYEHGSILQASYGYSKLDLNSKELQEWVANAAENARSNEWLAQAIVIKLRSSKILLPAPSTLERLCAESLVSAEVRITKRIASRIGKTSKESLQNLLEEKMSKTMTRFVWLRQHEVGNNSRVINDLLDRLELIQAISLSPLCLADIPLHRVARLRRQGERYFADGMRDLPEHRRLAILAVCAIEWQYKLSDSLIETHDRIVGKLYRSSERARDTQISDQRSLIRDTLASFAEVGASLVAAKEAGEHLSGVIEMQGGWGKLSELVDNAQRINAKVNADPLDFVTSGYARFRRYVPRLLRTLDIKGNRASKPIISALDTLKILNESKSGSMLPHLPISFARPKWQSRLHGNLDRKTWETALLFTLRDSFRSGDVWLETGRRFGQLSTNLVPIEEIRNNNPLSVPFDANQWVNDRKVMLDLALRTVGNASEQGLLSNSSIENGELHLKKLARQSPKKTDELVLSLYRKLPQIRITDLLIEVDKEIGFTEAFTDIRTGSPCRDQIGLLTVLLSDGVNLGLTKMAAASNAHGYWELLRIAKWHIQEDAYDRALAMIVESQSNLPMASNWGEGLTASADGQFFPVGGVGEAMNVVNMKYGREPGIKAYTHVSDQYAPFVTQAIPATAHEASYILDGLLSNDAGRQIKEQYSDTGGFTDHVFAMCALLGYTFAPRIRDLPSKRLYSFNPTSVHKELKPLVAGRLNSELIVNNWPDILRAVASCAANTIKPSELLKKLASYPRQNELGLALREIGRVERSLFMLRWMTDEQLQHRVQLGLNKGEAHHALKRALSFNRHGEIRDRTLEGQHYRIAGMNLLAAAVIYWNTKKLGELVQDMKLEGNEISPEILAHTSPLGWEHIILTGEYRWPNA